MDEDIDNITVTARADDILPSPPIENILSDVNAWKVFRLSNEDRIDSEKGIAVDLYNRQDETIFWGDYSESEYIALRHEYPELGLPVIDPSGGYSVEGKSLVRDGNTTGVIQNQAPVKNVSPANANPVVATENDDEAEFWTDVLDGVQVGLDIVGLIPVVSIAADGLNALIYTARDDYGNAALSAAAMVPFAGWGAKGAKYAMKAEKAIIKSVKTEKSAIKAEQQVVKKGKDKAGAKIKPTKLPKKKLKCFFSYMNKKFQKMLPADKKKFLKEYSRQLKRQQDAINDMTATEFMIARKAYKKEGRNKSAQQLQENYRKVRAQAIQSSLVKTLKKQGASPADAKKIAKERTEKIMDNMAALHEPDMVAGGWNDPKPSGLGNTKVNSSIGGSWTKSVNTIDDVTGKPIKESRIITMEKTANDAIKNGQGNVKMNIELEVCRGKGK